MSSRADTLTPPQQRFVDEYLVDLNATAAYRRAGYKARSDAVAASSASDLLRVPKIASAVQKAQQARSKATGVTAARVIEELACLGFSCLSNYEIDDQGQVTLTQAAPSNAMQAVSSIRRKVRHMGEGRIEYDTEIKLWDKPAPLKTLSQHLGLLVKRLEHTGDVKMQVIDWDALCERKPYDDPIERQIADVGKDKQEQADE